MSHDHVTMTVGCVSSDSGAALTDVHLDSRQEMIGCLRLPQLKEDMGHADIVHINCNTRTCRPDRSQKRFFSGTMQLQTIRAFCWHGLRERMSWAVPWMGTADRFNCRQKSLCF